MAFLLNKFRNYKSRERHRQTERKNQLDVSHSNRWASLCLHTRCESREAIASNWKEVYNHYDMIVYITYWKANTHTAIAMSVLFIIISQTLLTILLWTSVVHFKLRHPSAKCPFKIECNWKSYWRRFSCTRKVSCCLCE